MSNFKKRIILLLCIFASSALLSTCALLEKKADKAVATTHDYWPTKSWRTSTPEKQGINSDTLADMFEIIQKNEYTIDSITIIRNGYMIADAYFYPFKKNKKHIIHSCTKSITSALVGIALDKGYITSVKQPLTEFFPQRKIANMDERKKAITLEHLLTMSSGLRTMDSYLYGWKGLYEMRKSRDWTQYVLDLPMAYAPGSQFDYSNCCSFLLSAIIQETTKMQTLKFARKHLFGPLGISDVKWRTSPRGIYTGWGEMWLKPHDMAKIGLLYLNKGLWEGKQVVPASWVKASTQGHINDNIFDRYGYQWRIDSEGYYMAVGYLGQFIYVVPWKNMVVVFTSDLEGSKFFIPRSLMNKYIIPAAESSESLSANPKGNSRLNSLLNMFAKAPDKGYIWTSEREGVAKNNMFVRKAPPAFKFKFPECSKKTATSTPDQIMAMKTPGGVRFQASVIDIPAGVKLANFGPKFYANTLMGLGSNIKVISNRIIRLEDGSTAYRTDIEWKYRWKYRGTIPLTTLVVSAYKDEKCIYLATHPTQYPNEVAPIVESLTFR